MNSIAMCKITILFTITGKHFCYHDLWFLCFQLNFIRFEIVKTAESAKENKTVRTLHESIRRELTALQTVTDIVIHCLFCCKVVFHDTFAGTCPKSSMIIRDDSINHSSKIAHHLRSLELPFVRRKRQHTIGI